VLAGGSETQTAKGSYTLEVEEDHGHEIIKFTVEKDCAFPLAMLGGAEYTYSIAKVNGKKTLTLAGHGSSVLNLTLTAVK
jgi:hypothetical protein